MSQNPRLDLNIVQRYWRRVPRRKFVATLTTAEGHAPDSAITYYIMDSMTELGIVMYQNQVSNGLLIGFTNSAQHDHDRWVLTAHETAEDMMWLRAARENLRRMTAYQGLAQGISDLRYDAQEVQRKAGGTLQEMPLAQMLRRLQLVDSNTTAAAVLPEHLSLQTMHRMLHHYPRWVGRNPEFKDIPQAIALRMHGFGPMLDTGYQLDGC